MSFSADRREAKRAQSDCALRRGIRGSSYSRNSPSGHRFQSCCSLHVFVFVLTYEPLLAGAVIVGATLFIWRAAWARQYFWAAGLVAVIVAFSPLFS